MEGCLAPSEIPGITSSDASVFGGIAENIIFADFVAQYGAPSSTDMFWDDNNPAAYLYFLAINNPHFTESVQKDYYRRLRTERLMKIPDIVVHRRSEKAFYEIKPDSTSGMAAGVQKVGTVSAIYKHYRLPYLAGHVYQPKDHRVAFFNNALTVTLNVRLRSHGLIVYRLCLRSDVSLELGVLATLLAYIVRQMNKQRGTGRFHPVDLSPELTTNRQLEELARVLGLTMASATTALVVRATWSHFWKAVAKRFAVRGGVSAALALADGPLPVGELLAIGIGIFTVIDIIRLSDELWQDAERIANQA